MTRVSFTDEQIIGILREHEAGAKATDRALKQGASEARLSNWKAKYGGMDVSDAGRQRQIEDNKETPRAVGRNFSARPMAQNTGVYF